MVYKFQNELLKMSKEFIRALNDEGISAEIIQDSFRDYSVKLSISKDDKTFGNVNLYYSPRRKAYSFRTYQLKDISIATELDQVWRRLSATSYATSRESHQIYVDGSFLDGLTGYGVVVLKDGQVIEELSGLVPSEFVRGTNQVAGELFATREAIHWCQRNSVRDVAIFYDYKGIEKWALGEWKARQSLTKSYAEMIRNGGVHIQWHKVDSHTGNPWNERADELARKSISSKSSELDNEENSVPEFENKAKGFVRFLKDNGYEAELKGIYGEADCAKIELSAENTSIGYVNIYRTKRVPFLPRYHELKDASYENKLDLLWQEYYYGERQLPFG